MMNRLAFLRNCVSTSIADDYEEFGKIAKDVSLWAASRDIEPSREELVSALESLIAEGDATSYLLSASPAKAQPVPYSKERLDELWFYLTPQGKTNVISVLELTRKE
jgi:hypothetical protein